MHTEQLLCWGGMTETEHSTTTSTNEEADGFAKLKLINQHHWINY